MTALGETPFNYREWVALEDAHVQMDKLLPSGGEVAVVDLVRAVFVKHNAQDCAGLALLHRHFDLDQGSNEVLVEHFVGGASVTGPSPQRSGLVPHTWMLVRTDSGSIDLIPMEFIEADAETPDCSTAAARVVSMTDLHQDLLVLLESLGLQKVLGINIIHRDSLRPPDAWYLKEKTTVSGRESVMKPVAEGEKAGSVSTSWIYKADGVNIADCCCNGRWACSDA